MLGADTSCLDPMVTCIKIGYRVYRLSTVFLKVQSLHISLLMDEIRLLAFHGSFRPWLLLKEQESEEEPESEPAAAPGPRQQAGGWHLRGQKPWSSMVFTPISIDVLRFSIGISGFSTDLQLMFNGCSLFFFPFWSLSFELDDGRRHRDDTNWYELNPISSRGRGPMAERERKRDLAWEGRWTTSDDDGPKPLRAEDKEPVEEVGRDPLEAIAVHPAGYRACKWARKWRAAMSAILPSGFDGAAPMTDTAVGRPSEAFVGSGVASARCGSWDTGCGRPGIGV